MLAKGASQLRFGFENPHKQHSRTSWAQPSQSVENTPKQHSRTSWLQPSRSVFRNIPHIDWACPPRFLVDPDWKMEAGSESQETDIQLDRESTSVEAIYYRESEIPSNPYVASNALDFIDISRIPVIPLDVINDEASSDCPLISAGLTVGEKATESLLPRDEVIGTAVALVALIKSKEAESQIDLELLIQLLSNPGMLDQLMKEHGQLVNQRSVITHAQPQERLSVPVPNLRPAVGGHSSERQNPRSNKNADMGQIRKLIKEYGVHLRDDRVKPVVKDASYYKRLISLHGMSQENDKPQGSVKRIGSQERRPCVYFNSPKGCRRGSSCMFQHIKVGLGGSGQGVKKTRRCQKGEAFWCKFC